MNTSVAGDPPPSPTLCPGCGLRLPATGLSWDPKLFASPECWQVYGEVAGCELAHPELVGRFHQLTVDTYGAQHSGGDGRGIRIAYSLVGLHLALDRGWSGLAVREAHQGMGRPQPSWPAFLRPAAVGTLTVLEVGLAGGPSRLRSLAMPRRSSAGRPPSGRTGHHATRKLRRWEFVSCGGWTSDEASRALPIADAANIMLCTRRARSFGVGPDGGISGQGRELTAQPFGPLRGDSGQTGPRGRGPVLRRLCTRGHRRGSHRERHPVLQPRMWIGGYHSRPLHRLKGSLEATE
jgi:Family of unknown function (DUF5946)